MFNLLSISFLFIFLFVCLFNCFFIFIIQSWAAITIQGNDLMNGEIGFVPGSKTVTIDEDGSRTGKDRYTVIFFYFSKRSFDNLISH